MHSLDGGGRSQNESDRLRLVILRALLWARTEWRAIGEEIFASSTPDEACDRVAKKWGLEKVVAQAIIDTQFRQLAASFLVSIESQIADLERRLGDEPKLDG